jgi:hypothetical protein
MRSKPIGTTRRPRPARDVERRRALRPEPATQTGPADLYPVDVTVNTGPRKSTTDRFSRMIITSEYLYVARTRNKGRDIDSVTRYALPSGDRVQTAAKRGSWGPFSWRGCGCGNSWGIHSRAKLIEIGNQSAPDA